MNDQLQLEERMIPIQIGEPRRQRSCSKRELLAGHPLFAGLEAEDIDRLVDYARIDQYAKGAIVFTSGDPGSGLFAVVSGAVRISGLTSEGKEVIHNVIHPGELFGEIALLDGRRRTANAVAMTSCDLLVLDRKDFIPFLKINPEIGLTLLSVLCERLRRGSDNVEDVLFLGFSSRLAKTVLRLSAPDQSGKRRVRATQKEMGQMIGLSRESTNKQLQSWVRNKWISVEKGGLIVKDADALEQFALEN